MGGTRRVPVKVPEVSRLVMIHGVCWGVGQSTLARRLASVLTDADVL